MSLKASKHQQTWPDPCLTLCVAGAGTEAMVEAMLPGKQPPLLLGALGGGISSMEMAKILSGYHFWLQIPMALSDHHLRRGHFFPDSSVSILT